MARAGMAKTDKDFFAQSKSAKKLAALFGKYATSFNCFTRRRLAALAACGQHEYQKSDNYLTAAKAIHKDWVSLIELFRALLFYLQSNYEQALAIMKKLQANYPKRRYLLWLLQKLSCEYGDWQHLILLLPAIKQQNILAGEAYHSLEEKTCLMLLEHAWQKGDAITQSLQVWKSFSKSQQSNPIVAAALIDYLLKKNEHKVAENILHQLLPKQWNERLVTYYSKVESSQPLKHLQRAEQWLKQHPQDPQLLICLGELCMRQQLWRKAQDYFQQAISLQPSAKIYFQLAQLHVQLQQTEQALICYKAGANLALT
jgi:HemY protein